MSSKRRTGSVNLSDLTGAIGANSVVDGRKSAPGEPESAPAFEAAAAVPTVVPQGSDGVFLANVPLDKLAANPRNVRDRIGSLDDLSTIVDHQLQPGTAVTRSAFLAVYPEDAAAIGDAEYVVINGCRRLAAAQHFGREGLDVVIRDSIAENQASVVSAAVIENIARENLDVIEEAKAVELLVKSLPSAAAAARMLGRTPAWVSQRRALLNLAPELQDALRAGELGVREARDLARVPMDSQVEAWLADIEERENPTPEPEPEPEAAADAASDDRDDDEREETTGVDRIVKALKGAKADPETVVAALEEFFDPDDLIRIGAMIK
ncbi:ParB N-terminal domain-containing protein [Rhodococcus hoagii]|nr:ParB N-terminal domain-containing protein [Prescottella equi]MBM4654189.1 ParB N-terminal domain-containing protein [Prescottella equi]MBM4719663.1 ParB N-terminal domain-containing protein [Prescottella equi]NKR23460.1 ParB N-terminal domain-containing protein [Prescottella equi]NKT55928.1 ParB N-terminal domain-containing protein [Prescottella equi]